MKVPGTYFFPCGDATLGFDIIDPNVTPDQNSIQVHVLDMAISVMCRFQSDDAKFGFDYLLEKIPAQNLNYEGEANLMVRVIEGMQKFKINYLL